MHDLLPPTATPSPSATYNSSLPPFLQDGSKVSLDKDGVYLKGKIVKQGNGTMCFVHKRHPNARREEFGCDLPTILLDWTEWCVTGYLVPGHKISTFDRSLINSVSDSVASIVSAVNLSSDCPPSLLKALAGHSP